MLPNLLPTTTADLLSWGLQSTLVLGAGWLLYHYVLRQERFFGYNQRFLGLLPWLALLGPLLVRAALPALLRQLPVAAIDALAQVVLPGPTVRPDATLTGVAPIGWAGCRPCTRWGRLCCCCVCWGRWPSSG